MKTLLHQNIFTEYTKDFNLFGKILTYSILFGIALSCTALFIGVFLVDNIKFAY